jgi:hypothetical protein
MSVKEFNMLGQMCWLPTIGSNGDKILHLRTNPSQPWRPYTAYPEYAVSDYNIPKGSKGWATYQKLMRAKWSLIPSDQAMQELSFPQQDLAKRIAS